MSFFKTKSLAEQVAEHLKEELGRGRWSGVMPGRDRLALEFGVSAASVQGGLEILRQEGLLVAQGVGRRHRIMAPQRALGTSLRITILLYEATNSKLDYIMDLQHQLNEAGFSSSVAPKSLMELGMKVERVAGMVGQVETDAWVVVAGSRPVLEWFAARSVPTLALFGRLRHVLLAAAGPEKVPACREAVRRLAGLGHRRIVMLAHEGRRKPGPGFVERAYLDELEACGIMTGPYNLPDWDDHPEGLGRCIAALFQHTPPTALIVQTPYIFHAVERHLARMGLVAPEHLSLICTDWDESFDWCRPSIAHISYDSRPWVRRIVRWAHNVAQGKDDRRRSLTKARFVEGGTIGPAP